MNSCGNRCKLKFLIGSTFKVDGMTVTESLAALNDGVANYGSRS